MTPEEVAGALAAGDADSLGPLAERLMSYAAVVTRTPAAAGDAVRDALGAAAGRADQAPVPDPPEPWLLALVRTESLRQLRARAIFVDTPGRVAVADGDPFDALTPGERDTLALALRDDIDRDGAARAMGTSVGVARSRVEDAQGAWTDIARALIVLRDGSDCLRLIHVADESVDEEGVLGRPGWRRVADHARECGLCSAAVDRPLREAVSELALPSTIAAPGVAARAAEVIADPERVVHLVERAGPWKLDGFPQPIERDDRDPRSWARRAAFAAAASAVLLLLGILVLALR